MRPAQDVTSDSESEPDPPDEDEDGMIYTVNQLAHGTTFRSRVLPRHPKGITTALGQLGAGETETEADEPVRRCHVVSSNFLTYSFPYKLAETLANCTYSASFRSACAAKQLGATHHTTPVPGIPSALHRTCSIWGVVQPVQCVVCSHKWKDLSNRLRRVCTMGTSS